MSAEELEKLKDLIRGLCARPREEKEIASWALRLLAAAFFGAVGEGARFRPGGTVKAARLLGELAEDLVRILNSLCTLPRKAREALETEVERRRAAHEVERKRVASGKSGRLWRRDCPPLPDVFDMEALALAAREAWKNLRQAKPTNPGRPLGRCAPAVARETLAAFEDLTGKQATRDGAYLDLLVAVFQFFGLKESAEQQARQAISLRSKYSGDKTPSK